MIPVLLIAAAFEKVALVDNLDFGRFADTETHAGTRQIVDQCVDTGANAVWWRMQGGAVPRHKASEEMLAKQLPGVEEMRVARNDVWGWLLLDRDEGGGDPLAYALAYCREKGLGAGIHYTLEEAHSGPSSEGLWNIHHPQYWCQSLGGKPWPGHASFGYDEVRRHKLQAVKECLACGGDTFYFDPMRYGYWSPREEYTRKMRDEFRAKTGREPPADWKDPAWTEHVASYMEKFLRGIKAECAAAGRDVKLIYGLTQMTVGETHHWKELAFDWKKLARERVVDGFVVDVKFDPSDPWESTVRTLEYVKAYAPGCKMYSHVSAYPYRGGYPTYAKAAGITDLEAAKKLVEIAFRTKMDGVVLECVDALNYKRDIMDYLKTVPSERPEVEDTGPEPYLQTPSNSHAKATRAFSGIPSLAISPVNGRFWCTWYSGPTPGEDENNYAVLATSTDSGETWKEVLVADPDGFGGRRAFDPEVWVSPDGKLRWSWTDRHGTATSSPDTDRLMCVVLSAEDEPKAPFGEPVATLKGIMMCKPTVLSSGEWLYPLAEWGGEPSSVFYATRDGATFERRGGATLPKKDRLFDETMVFERRDASLVAFIRTRFNTRLSESRDAGRTWSEPVEPSEVGSFSTRIFVRRLKSGNVLLVKNGRTPVEPARGRKFLTAYLSRDDGRSWEGGLLLDDRAPAAYPDGDQAADGVVHVVYDHNRSKDQDIYLASFTEEDVLAGRPVSSRCRLRRVVTRK